MINKFSQIAIKCNTSNQYCTMCITGQNRTVSNELNCVCKAGYGDDGVSQICVQCHYTCENCNGSLKTDCTSCSSLSNRYLTTDNQCLCNQAYIDSGLNDVNCLYICHHSCSDCDSGGEDQCTSCPSTRQPDRIGTTFKCLCKDPHYFSDDIQLECLECHSTCKTCNGIYENTVLQNIQINIELNNQFQIKSLVIVTVQLAILILDNWLCPNVSVLMVIMILVNYNVLHVITLV